MGSFFYELINRNMSSLRKVLQQPLSELHVIPCGTLRVKADQMIQPFDPDQVDEKYGLDPEGRMQLAMNALLVIQGDRKLLIDPGAADFLPGKLAQQYGFEKGRSLEEHLADLNLEPEQITDVIFTHLHFDHGSGAFRRVPGRIENRFPLARYHLLKAHYEYALQPDPSEADAFFIRFLHFLGELHWLEEWDEEWISFRVCNGHTRGMVVPVIHRPQGNVYYLTDLVPMSIFLDRDVYSGYDLDSGLALREKREILAELQPQHQLVYFHELLENNNYEP